MKDKQIILGLTASIAIYKAAEIIQQLKKDNFSVNVIMTENARRLISPRLFATLSNNRTFYNEFEDPADFDVEHISLAKKANLILLAPATANIIGKIAGGIADDLLTSTIIATKAPVLIAPAMNEDMYKNKIVQANIQKLKQLGYRFIGPRKGRLACGETGIGHLADVDEIIKQVKRFLKHGD
ncbi:MAG: hypothetical protein ISS44_00675 [Candidatus Omnitrophica bacterium]|nr:hypothetical protein [Candidatus Omnitrophota bacterium]